MEHDGERADMNMRSEETQFRCQILLQNLTQFTLRQEMNSTNLLFLKHMLVSGVDLASYALRSF